jgi:tyrosyl-tRNA synthetase
MAFKKMDKEIKNQLQQIAKGTEDILLIDELERLLASSVKSKKALNIKLGLDPTAPDIHLGHTVVLTKLRQFQDLGHEAILIIGDYTARIGDPSGRSTLRPSLSAEAIEENSKTYMNQAFKILDNKKIKILKNSSWLGPLKLADILNLTSRFTIARMLERDDFKKRFNSNTPITIMEFLYPLMQAYDSVAIKADIELGGTDQRFNLLMGRELQKEFGQKPQIAITMPILTGTDGVNKMSKSLGNYIGVSEEPSEIFGKVMSIPDQLIIDYFKLLTRVDSAKISEIENNVRTGRLNPSFAKRDLAKKIIENLYDGTSAAKAENDFDKIFKMKEIPDEIDEFYLSGDILKDGKISLPDVLVKTGLSSSKGEAKRLLEQGGIKVDGKTIRDIGFKIKVPNEEGIIIQRGKRHFKRILTDKL